MTNGLYEEKIYEEAKKRVKAKQEFYKHLAVYAIVNTMLILIWAFAAGGGYPWFVWVLGGWGIGIIFNFLDAFVWIRKKNTVDIEKEAEKIKRERR